jgi:hypothetical protein
MSNNLSVKITADVVDLQAKFAVAKAEVNGLASEMNKLAKASATGMIDSAGQARLQQVAGDFLHAKETAAQLSDELKKTADASRNLGDEMHGGVGGALEEIRGKISSAFEVTGIAVAYEAVERLGAEIEKLGERAIQMRSYSEILNVDVQQFQAMQVAAEEAGVSTEVLARASERLSVMLNEARNHSSSAVEKLFALGITTEEIADPAFQLIQLLQVLRERLEGSATEQTTMNALMAEFGPRAALAAVAIKEFDGSQQAVARVMHEINGLTDDNSKAAAAAKAEWAKFGTATENTFTKFLFGTHAVEGGISGLIHSMSDLSNKAKTVSLPAAFGGNSTQASTQAAEAAAEGQRNVAKQTAEIQADVSREILKQEMENAKAGVEAFKEGSVEKLSQLKTYAEAARAYYGSDEVDAVKKANQQIIGEQRAYAESQKQEMAELFSGWASTYAAINNEHAAMLKKERTDEERLIKENERDEQELYGGWASTYTQINDRHREMLEKQAADAKKNAKEESRAWQGVVGEIENAESAMVSNILTKRKSLAQSLIQLSGQLVTQEIANDLRAMTTRLLLKNAEVSGQKALEQGGFLYHLFVEHQKTAATVASQAAQTGATITGNTARLTATTSANAAAHAQSATIGAKTVMQDAAKAFTGTYASVAQIPYVGWILAPVAAAGAFAAVAGYESLASLDTGTNYVPRDMVAQIHEGERIVPKRYNPDANPGISNGSGGYHEEHNYSGDVHVSAFDGASMAKALRRPGGRNAVVGSLMQAYRRGAR